MSDLDIVPRGPHRWHRAAANYVNKPHTQAAKLYEDRLAEAYKFVDDLEAWAQTGPYFKHTETSRHPSVKPTVFYTCSPLCAGMAKQTRQGTVESVSNVSTRVRCEVCGKTDTQEPLFNVAFPGRADVDSYTKWYANRVADHDAKYARLESESEARRAERQHQQEAAREAVFERLEYALGDATDIEIVKGDFRLKDGRRVVTVIVGTRTN